MTDAECAVPESAADVVAYLTSQHQQIAGLLDAVVDTDGEQRTVAFKQFRRLLAVHEASEQEIVHPRATYELADGRLVVADRLREEQELCQSIV